MTLYLPGFASALKVYLERLDFTTVKWLSLELSRCVKHFYNFKGQPWLSEQYTIEMLDWMSKVVETVQLDKAERLSQFEGAKRKMTEEDVEEFYEDIERIDKVLNYVMEITGVCLRTMPDLVSDTILAKFVAPYAKALADVTKSKEYELICSLCFFCDCLEHGSANLLNTILTQLPEKFFQVMQIQQALPLDEVNRDLVQTCIFGMGLLCMKMPAETFPLANVFSSI